MKKTNVLVTGASGTVGFEVLQQLLDQEDFQITVFDKTSKISEEKLMPFKDRVDLIFGDITTSRDLQNIKDIDVAIHLAAIIPPLADELPELAQKVNTEEVGS